MINASFEHLALNVPNMETMADWYCEHMGMTRVRHDPNKKVFLADRNGIVVLELYSNTAKPMIPLSERTSAEIHLAFVVDDIDASIAEATAAGAVLESKSEPDYAGDVLSMLRDPFGLPLQLLTRSKPLLG
jgi:glyoxylase I family protein